MRSKLICGFSDFMDYTSMSDLTLLWTNRWIDKSSEYIFLKLSCKVTNKQKSVIITSTI